MGQLIEAQHCLDDAGRGIEPGREVFNDGLGFGAVTDPGRELNDAIDQALNDLNEVLTPPRCASMAAMLKFSALSTGSLDKNMATPFPAGYA